MNDLQSVRLAKIRADMEKWRTLANTNEWYVVLLLAVLDVKNERIRQLEKDG